MISIARKCSALVALLFVGCGAASDDYEPAAPPPPPPAPAVEPAPLPEPYTAEASSATPPPGAEQPPPPPAASAAPPPPAPSEPPQGAASSDPLVASYPTGQWVYLAGQGWVWVPAGSTTTDMEGVPYTYLYTPAYGWTWYVSPWGWGPYHYGIWARHPWHPVGLHGYWVARPRAVVRLGPRHFRR
jgi:hypothetical protein